MASWTNWSGMTNVTPGGTWLSAHTQNIEFTALVNMIDYLSGQAVSKIANIRSKKSAMSIADMFDLQMAMNKLSQFTEMSTDVVSAVNTSANSISRNIKG
jgi:hypothetical protein